VNKVRSEINSVEALNSWGVEHLLSHKPRINRPIEVNLQTFPINRCYGVESMYTYESTVDCNPRAVSSI